MKKSRTAKSNQLLLKNLGPKPKQEIENSKPYLDMLLDQPSAKQQPRLLRNHRIIRNLVGH